MKKKEKEQINMQKGTDQNIDFYSRFLPMELFEDTKAAGKMNLSTQVQRELKATVLSLNIAGFQEMVKTKHTTQIYALINEIISICIPVIYEQGGIVYEFMDAGFSALFIQNPSNALKAAIHVCELIENKKSLESYLDSFSLGFAYGSVMAGIVGHERRLSPLVLSVFTGLSKYIQEMGKNYGSKILVTGTFAERIPEFFKQFNSRLLGYMYIKNGDFIEKIYDVFDGDSTQIRNQKRKTKVLFEKGVRLFTEEKFTESRYYFVEVLKTDHRDKAAMVYIQLCEKNAGTKNGKNIFLAVY